MAMWWLVILGIVLSLVVLGTCIYIAFRNKGPW